MLNPQLLVVFDKIYDTSLNLNPMKSLAKFSTSLFTVFFIHFACNLLASQNSTAWRESWPQWRGPDGNGVAVAGNPPVKWNESSNVKWKVKIPGSGYSTPVIWKDRIFVSSAINTGKKAEPSTSAAVTGSPQGSSSGGRGPGGQGRPGGGGRRGGFPGMTMTPTEIHQFVVLCLDRGTGNTIWQTKVDELLPHEGYKPNDGSFASVSPITDGEHVFASFGSRGLYCLDMSGNVKWKKDFGDMRIKMGFGEGSSPALHGDTLVVNWDHEDDSFITALDKATGKELWRTARDEATTWATPLIVEMNGKLQAIISATSKIRSYDLATGKQVWESDGLTANVIPSPVFGHGMAYAMSGFRGSSLQAINLGNTGNLSGTDAIAWTYNRDTPYVPSPLLYGERLYFLKSNSPIISCLDAKTGRPHFTEVRIDGIRGVYASPVGAGGRVYVVGREGAAVVLKDSETMNVLATNKLDDKFDASPVVVGDELYLRGHEHLYCLAE